MVDSAFFCFWSLPCILHPVTVFFLSMSRAMVRELGFWMVCAGWTASCQYFCFLSHHHGWKGENHPPFMVCCNQNTSYCIQRVLPPTFLVVRTYLQCNTCKLQQLQRESGPNSLNTLQIFFRWWLQRAQLSLTDTCVQFRKPACLEWWCSDILNLLWYRLEVLLNALFFPTLLISFHSTASVFDSRCGASSLNSNHISTVIYSVSLLLLLEYKFAGFESP